MQHFIDMVTHQIILEIGSAEPQEYAKDVRESILTLLMIVFCAAPIELDEGECFSVYTCLDLVKKLDAA